MKRSDCQMITDIAMIPIGASAVLLYVVVGGSLLLLHNVFVAPLVYAKTGNIVSSHKEIAKFYGRKKKVVPVT